MKDVSVGLLPGTRLGTYEILALLGAGGMGEVYRARDSRLGCDVALKVLPGEVAANAERRARFEREARAVASLNHAHIVTLYSLEEADGTLFITLELVEGETLAALAARERLSTAALLRLASAVADAIGCAHERGVLHRDLKPANIMLTSDGDVKVLDFGLAKLRDSPSQVGVSGTVATTRVGPITGEGVILGTPDYMSPEQAERESIDERSDIFSLGVILYELATGTRPFTGGSVMSIISSILRDTPPPITELNALAPPALADIVHRCLCKDPAHRYQTARALRDDLEGLRQQVDTRPTPAASSAAPRPSAASRRSVAVLPFLNLSADPENEYFADGIAEDIIAQLSKMRSLKVISRTSAMQFKKREMSLREIAAKLGVATLIEGSVRRIGTRVRIVAELIDAATDEHLWADTYDRQLTDVFEIQSEVALRIAEALEAELTPGERARIQKPAAVDLLAYELFLKGRQCLYRFTQDGFSEALHHFERAVAIQPGYALAHNGIALVYLLQGGGHGTGALEPREALVRAREAVDLALTSDPLCGDAHATLATLRCWFDFDWTGAEQSFGRALELNPGSSFLLGTYALMLSAQERFDEAIAAQKRARDLDPLAPVVRSDLSTTYLRAGRVDDAVREARRLIELDPGFPCGHSALGWGLLLGGHPADAVDELRKAVALSPGNTIFLAQLGEALGFIGEREEALRVLHELERMAQERYVMPYHLAYVYTGLGEDQKALDLLEQAVDEGGGGVYGIKGSFLFTTLRHQPRFLSLLRRMNLDDRFRTGGITIPRPAGPV